MKPIYIFPTGHLTSKAAAAISKAGAIAIEAPDPSKVVSVIPGVPLLTGDDLLAAAMSALTLASDSSGNRNFVVRVNTAVQEAMTKRHGSGS